MWAGPDLSAGELSGFPDPSISQANWLVKVVIQNVCSAVCFARTMAVWCVCPLDEQGRLRSGAVVGQYTGWLVPARIAEHGTAPHGTAIPHSATCPAP